MTQELFVECIEALQKQSEIDRKCCEAFDIILPNDYTSGYNNDILSNMIIKILKNGMDDNKEYSDIDYYIYELEFGSKYKKGCVTDGGKNINLSTSEYLWKYLDKKKGSI